MTEKRYLPGNGWKVAGVGADGTVWAEPIIAWEFDRGIGAPVLADVGSTLISDQNLQDGHWLVAPDEAPETSRYRPAKEA